MTTQRKTTTSKVAPAPEPVEATVEETEGEFDPWELESGLPNDVDAYMAHCHFGTRDQYMQQIVAGGGEGSGLMFLFDLVDENGEIMGNQGYTVGSGWDTEDDGASIVHPTRKNVVASSRYGQLQHRTVKELEVDMRQYGIPTVAATWEGLGFHWMLEEHTTLKQLEGGEFEKKQGLMPTEFIGVSEAIRGGEVAPAEAPEAGGVEMSEELEAELTRLAQENDYKTFIMAAMKVGGVASSDEIMSYVMDESAEGFFATHQG
jgi:hypothetical protein